MYLVGARFESLEAAKAAIAELRQQTGVEPSEIGLRPLGSLRYDEPARGHVVAGRFGSRDVPGVLEIIDRHGGEVVFKRTEWRRPRPLSGGSERTCARCQRLTRLGS
jgi:hypothetical protein